MQQTSANGTTSSGSQASFRRSASDVFFNDHRRIDVMIQQLRDRQPSFEKFLQQYALTPGTTPDLEQIANEFNKVVQQYWTTKQPTEYEPAPRHTPLQQLQSEHRKMLSTQANLRVADGTLSAESKALIDKALRYPTLADREAAFPAGARPGVYPLTIDDGTPNGASLAGAFMITARDGSSAQAPHWPDGSRRIAANDLNGPVVLYTPGEGFEEFQTPAQARAALAQRLDDDEPRAQQLEQSLPWEARQRRQTLQGDDLAFSFSPGTGDVQAEAMTQLLASQAAEVKARLARLFGADKPLTSIEQLNAPEVAEALNQASDWSEPFTGYHAMLARLEKLNEQQQPHWLKNLSADSLSAFESLDQAEQQSLDTLVPLLEEIPSLHEYAQQKLSAVLKERYPTLDIDPSLTKVLVSTSSIVHTGRPTPQQQRTIKTDPDVSLVELALRNPTEWPEAKSSMYSEVRMTARLFDSAGKPVMGADGKPFYLHTDELKALCRLDVGGNYLRLLDERMDPEAVTGGAGELRSAWKANLADSMNTQAYLAQFDPDAFLPGSNGISWLMAVLDHPDPATRPQVDGRTVTTHTVSSLGQRLQGVMAIGNNYNKSLVLFTPDAPDGRAFREVIDQAALEELLAKPEWETYVKSRKDPVDPNGLTKAVEDLKGQSQRRLERLMSHEERSSHAYLKPMQGNFQDVMYTQLGRLTRALADARSVSNLEVDLKSYKNKFAFGLEVAVTFMDLLPVLGKGASALRRLASLARLPVRGAFSTLKNSRLLSTIYSRIGKGASAVKRSGKPLLRPVVQPPAPSSSAGIRGSLVPPAPGATSAPLPDLSAHALPDSLLSGRAMRGDGTYQVADQFYIRYTDGTGTPRIFEISPVYKAGEHVRVIDPHSRKTVAFLSPANNGEWRLNRMFGGAPGDELLMRGRKRVIEQNADAAGSSSSGVRPPLDNKRLRLPGKFPGEKATLEPPVKGKNVFYHYTGKDSHASILADRSLAPSSRTLDGKQLPRTQGRHYFTDLAPTDQSVQETSKTIFGRRKHGNTLDKMTHYYEVNTSGLTVHPTQNPHIFYVETEFHIPLKYPDENSVPMNRIISHGKTLF
ncbi:dermonecrotic toxin domain-containing protein [Pseudomonas lactucae]|uniref:Dermonecrotic toxin N-terminal domain-containing protein n=1 Tax=Pseudomonas lactucae TaxID=2813360 RepID=A0A9X0YDQ1_9PSED|nr:hypothetical protein [Pseudomonas lactucae]MBN2987925.1 hypothetical protein [Pseudomonas lactucae]